ncbi:MAG: hypothetical protein H6605_05860 [Flavobacteriales bacterium]|nr:hypothetical protein [Flavobacteriales bacterium]
MKRIIFISCLILSQMIHAQVNFRNISILDASFMNFNNAAVSLNENEAFKNMESKFTFGNLRLYMLKANQVYLNPNRNIGNYLSLQEALKDKKILITEVEGGQVNNLHFENISKDTIMILAGEVVTGGKQDRVIGQDVLLPPKSGKVLVSVFCVEHGRWSPKTTGNQFTGYYGVSTNSVRSKAVVDKNQHAVWDNVAKVNAQNKTESSTGTYTKLHTSDVLSKELPKYVKHFEDLVNSDSTYIGFVAVSGDSIIACDLFANNQLFKKQAPNLIKSSAIEAITNGSVVTIAASSVLSFLSKFMMNEERQEDEVKSSGTMLKNNNKKLHINYYKK